MIRNIAAAIGGALIAVGVPALWVAGASNLYCALLGRTELWVFPFNQWLLAAPWWRQNWWMTVCVVVSAAIPTLIFGLVALVIVQQFRRRRRLVRPSDGGLRPIERGVTDNHGHADFAAPQDVFSRFSSPGCLIGRMPDEEGVMRLVIDDVNQGPGHSMVFAGPGGFKSVSAVSRIWHWRGPRVVFDPSCEIGPIMTEALKADGKRVISIGLTGQGLNVLDWIDVRHPEADAHIRTAVDWIYNEGATSRSGGDQGRDPFWSNWGKALVTCLLAHILYQPNLADEERTLAALRMFIGTPENQMQLVLAGIFQTSHSAMARDIAGGLMGMKAEETFSGIYSNAFSATEWLSVGAYADVVSGNAMRTADILDRDTVVFVQLPLRSLLATPSVGRAVMGALFNAMFHADGSVHSRILFQIDEAWILGRMKEILLCHTTARKYGGAVCTAWQSEGQLEETWGREGAKTMRDTCSWRSFNAIQDGDVAEKLSRDIGHHAVMAHSEGDNRGSQKPWGIALPSSNRGRSLSTHEIKRRLITGDEIMRSRANRMFILARDFAWPIDAETAPYFDIPDLVKRLSGNRFVRAAE